MLTEVQIRESDIAAQAQFAAAQVARGAQNAAKNGTENFNRFVEGNGGSGSGSGSGAYRTMPLDESKKDFWDSFADAGAARQSAVGTSAIKKSNGSSSGAGAGPGAKSKMEGDDWDKW